METLWLIVSIAVAIYLAVDAPKHGKSSLLWAILGFILGLLALGIYFIQIGKKGLGWTITIVILLFYFLLFVLVGAAALFFFGLFF